MLPKYVKKIMNLGRKGGLDCEGEEGWEFL